MDSLQPLERGDQSRCAEVPPRAAATSDLPPELEAFVAAVCRDFGASPSTALLEAALSEPAAVYRAGDAAGGPSSELASGPESSHSSMSESCAAPQALGSSLPDISQKWDDSVSVESFEDKLQRLKSRQRAVLALVKQCEREAAERGLQGCIFKTLTAASDDWDPHGAISAYSDKLAKLCWRMGFKPLFLWVAEPQMENDCRIHWHLLVWVPRRSWRWKLPMPDSSGMWKHGSSGIEWVRRPGRYVAKYMGKVRKGGTERERELATRIAVAKWDRFRDKYATPRHPGYAGKLGRRRRRVRTFAAVGLGKESRSRVRYARLPGYVRRRHAYGTVARPRSGWGYVVYDGTKLLRLCAAYRMSFIPGVGKDLSVDPRWYLDALGSPVPSPAAYHEVKGGYRDALVG